jgi:tetraacyldisaccharide 4'-kinase
MWQPPAFWHKKHSILQPTLLAPFAGLYSSAVWLRRAVSNPFKANYPIICIGNPGLGGAGKTPVAIAVAKHLIALGNDPHFLTRGYGGKKVGPLRVDIACHDASQIGDEPLLLARHAPTFVAKNRLAGVKGALAAGAEIIIMDDGFQNPTTKKDCSILVIDGSRGIGNGWVFPAGPMREPISRQLKRADILLVIGNGSSANHLVRSALLVGTDVLRAQLIASPSAPNLNQRNIVAFCGIADPDKFFNSIEDMGGNVVARRVFPDHQMFSSQDVTRLLELGESNSGSLLLTTEKDMVRIGSNNDPNGRLRDMASVLPIEIKWDDPNQLTALLCKTGVLTETDI